MQSLQRCLGRGSHSNSTVHFQRLGILETGVLIIAFAHLDTEGVADMVLAIFTPHWAGVGAAYTRVLQYKWGFKCFQSCEPLERVLLQALLHKICAHVGDVAVVLWLRLSNLADHFPLVLALEREVAHDHLVADHAHRPHIYLLVVAGAAVDLRSLVVERPDVGQHLQLLVAVLDHFGDLKIDKLDLSGLGVEQNILWLDVPVANSLRVQVHQRMQNTRQNLCYLCLLYYSILQHVEPQIRSLAILQHQVAYTYFLVYEQMVRFYNVGVVQVFQHPKLSLDAPDDIQVLFPCDFDRVLLLGFLLDCFIDNRLSALVYFLDKVVQLVEVIVNKHFVAFKHVELITHPSNVQAGFTPHPPHILRWLFGMLFFRFPFGGLVGMRMMREWFEKLSALGKTLLQIISHFLFALSDFVSVVHGLFLQQFIKIVQFQLKIKWISLVQTTCGGEVLRYAQYQKCYAQQYLTKAKRFNYYIVFDTSKSIIQPRKGHSFYTRSDVERTASIDEANQPINQAWLEIRIIVIFGSWVLIQLVAHLVIRAIIISYDRRYCEQFQNTLSYDKIDKIWKSFREAGNSLEGRISRSNFKKVMSKYNVKNEKFLDKLYDRFKLQKFTDVRAERQEIIDLQDFVIGLVIISLINFVEKVRYIFYLTDLDQDGCLSLEEIENMIERIEKIFCKENSSAKIESFSLLIDIAHKKAQRNYKEVLFLLYKNNPGLKNDDGGLITCDEFIEALKGSKDLYREQKFIPLNISLAQVIENVAAELSIKITEENKGEFCKFRKDLYTILQKGSDQKDQIKYPWKVEITKGDKIVEVLPNVEKIIEKDKKQQKTGGKVKGGRTDFKELFDQKSGDQTLQSYQLKVKKMKETKEDPKLNIKFDKVVKKS